MGTTDEIIIKLTEFIKNNFYYHDEAKVIDSDLSLMDKGVIDSTGILELIEFIEDTFSISIENDEIVPENLDSINKMRDFINRKAC